MANIVLTPTTYATQAEVPELTEGQTAFAADTRNWLFGAALVPGSGHIIEEEGTPVTQRANINFTGAGVSVADVGGKIVVTIAGGAGEAFPVGSVFIAVVSTNPGTLLGYGTWAAIAAGRVLIGLDAGDTDFDVVEETGGAKTATPDAHAGTAVANHVFTQPSGHDAHIVTQPAQHAAGLTDTETGTRKGGTSGAATLTDSHDHATPALTHTGTAVDAHSAHTGGAVDAHGVTQPNAHAALPIVQPYFVVYIWKRTA